MAKDPQPLGIVRPARRPPGFVARGPSPEAPDPGVDPEVWPREGEDLCYLLGDWRILQRVDGHRWSLDDLATAWYAARVATPLAPGRILDLGCGVGSVLLMLAWRFPEAEVVGVEAQPLSVELARRSIRFNGVSDRCTVVQGDLREVTPGGTFDLVTGTPPYFPADTATRSSAPQKGPCRHEDRGDIGDYARAALGALAPEGLFVACHAARQRARATAAITEAGFAITSWIDILGKVGKRPLVNVFAMRPGVGPVPDPDPHLAVRDPHDQWTPEFAALRRDMGMPDKPPRPLGAPPRR